jgi:hypothetical protein
LYCRRVCKTCAFHDALQAGKQREVHPPNSPDLVPASARSGDAIRQEVLTIDPQLLARAMGDFKRRIENCIQEGGRYLNDIIFHT